MIQISHFLDHPPAAVWRALTDHAIHAKWWAAGDVKAVVGHRFTLDMGPWVRIHRALASPATEQLRSPSD